MDSQIGIPTSTEEPQEAKKPHLLFNTNMSYLETVKAIESTKRTYYTVQDWMIEKLKLGGACLHTFACIWSFCKKDSDTWFLGGYKELAKICGLSLRTAKRAVATLLDADLLIQNYWYDLDGRYHIALQFNIRVVGQYVLDEKSSDDLYKYISMQLCTEGQNVTGMGDKMAPVNNRERITSKNNCCSSSACTNEQQVSDETQQAQRRSVPTKQKFAAIDRQKRDPYEIPSYEAVCDYLEDEGLDANPEELWHICEKQDWCDTFGNPIRSWTAFVAGMTKLLATKRERELEAQKRKKKEHKKKQKQASKNLNKYADKRSISELNDQELFDELDTLPLNSKSYYDCLYEMWHRPYIRDYWLSCGYTIEEEGFDDSYVF